MLPVHPIEFTRKLLYAVLILGAFPTIPENTFALPDTLTDRYAAMALQGDLSGAGALFSEVDSESSALFEAELAQQYQARFVDRIETQSPDTGDEFADAVVSIYRDYWVRTLTGEMTPAEGGLYLEHQLNELLESTRRTNRHGHSSDVFAPAQEVLREKGFYFLETPAPPLRDLFLWKAEEIVNYTVRLTDQSLPVRVTFLTDMYSMGWKEFATLGLVSTTGWVEGVQLYCISNSYDRNSEKFRVSYLKHESRHLADFERFPGLSSLELEYRAKLTELAFATTSLRDLLDDFTVKSADNTDSPHAYANYRVTRDMYQAIHDEPFPATGNPWQGVNVAAANKAARKLLKRNTAILEAEDK